MTRSADAAPPVIQARGLRVDLPGARGGLLRRRGGVVRVVNGVDLDIHAADTLWLVGGAGDGAVEAGLLLAGELVPTSGTVEFDGRDLNALRGRRRARAQRQVVRLGGDADANLGPRRTALEVVARAAAGSARSVTPEHESRARDLLARFGVRADSAAAPTAALSAEERHLVAAARVLALRPRVVVFQPAGLPDADDDTVWAALTGLRDEASTALVVVGHDLPATLRQGEAAIVLCGGRVVEVLGPGDLAHPLHPFTVTLRGGPSGPTSESHAAASRSRSTLRASAGGCPFGQDCPRAKARCATEVPRLTRPLGATHDVACHFPEDPRRPKVTGAATLGPRDQAVTHTPPTAGDEPTAREFAEG